MRPDICDSLIHFTKDKTDIDALSRLITIVTEGRLIGGTGMIRGDYPCVCFTEAPLPMLTGDFVKGNLFSRYSGFGVMVEKRWLYDRGGRPVIYQGEGEFELLPETLRWRHVRYEPTAKETLNKVSTREGVRALS